MQRNERFGAGMLIQKLKLNYFGRFQNREIELKPGINLVYGENEAGKSTLHTFIKGMLFGIERLRGRGSASKEDLYTRYLPWDYPGAFGGSMDIVIGEKEYRLIRSFHASDKSFTILDLATGREIKLKEGLIGELLPGLTEAAFRNTISIEQLKAQTDSELAAQMRNYIANLSVAKSKEVDVAKALSYLTEQRKQLEASQNQGELRALQSEIEEGLAKEERMDQLIIKLQELLLMEQQLDNQKESVAVFDQETTYWIEQLPAILEKYRVYQELVKQITQLETKEEEINARLLSRKKEEQLRASLKEDYKAAEGLRIEIREQERLLPEYRREQDKLKKARKRMFFISLLPAILLVDVIILSDIFPTLRLYLGLVLLVSGVIVYLILNHKNKKALQKQDGIIKECLERIKHARSLLEEILYRYGVSSMEALSELQEERMKSSFALEHAEQQLRELELRRKEAEDQQDELYDVIMKYLRYFIPVEELSTQTMQLLQEELHKRKQESEDKLAVRMHQAEQIKLQIAKLKWEITSLEGNEEQLLKKQQRYQELLQQYKEDAIELGAIKLAYKSIQELSTEIHDSFGQELNQAVSKVISEVTNHKYQELKIDEKLEVKVGWNGDYVLLERLSAGTIDQVYFSLRLAVADLLFCKNEVPLLLDDSFALYDDRRVKAALSELAKRSQTILFTCHKRERELLDELGHPYQLIDLSKDHNY